jgi:xanthine dehydrogenase accessory factor
MVEPHAAPHTAVVVGAGHVGLHTARMARAVGFRTVVLDDRKEFANRERFPEANEVKVIPGFTGCFDELGVNGASFVLILTRGHVHDKVVLAQALKTGAGYLGMIGSRKKRDAIYDALVEEGVPREELSRVFCPIGLDIDAETPEEIAVSIVAEMIQIRAGMQ